MIYAALAFAALDNRTAAVVFDRDFAMYGPYAMDGWQQLLGPDECLFAFCCFKRGGSTIDVHEHHRMMLAKETPSECIGRIFGKATLELDSIRRTIDSSVGKMMVQEYAKENFHSMWDSAKTSGQHDMRQVAEELGVTFNEVESAIVG